jgi:hypothetical protein
MNSHRHTPRQFLPKRKTGEPPPPEQPHSIPDTQFRALSPTFPPAPQTSVWGGVLSTI